VDAQAWDDRYRERELVWSGEPNVFVAEEIADLPPGRALDLAAGEGRNAIWLASRGWEVEAVEFSQVALDKAQTLADEVGVRVALTHADLTELPSLAPAELVLVAYLHLPRAVAADVLRHAAALVRPEGTFLLVAHARRNLEEGHGGPQDPDVLPEVHDVLEVVEAAGLEVRRAEEVTRRVATDEGERDAIDVLVRAVRPRARA
jgi:SAM-dependent methyltransferase